MPIRYMGTKRSVATHVQAQLAALAPAGPVLDLFSGIGCVAERLATIAPVHTNDALSFTAVLARARFKGERRKSVQQLVSAFRPAYRESSEQESRKSRSSLRAEQRALDHGQAALASYMDQAEHAGNSARIRRLAITAAATTDISHYRMIRFYFAAGYFSTRQAIQLDALRFAIDGANLTRADRDWALSAWISAAATLINAPGHTAQYLRPNSEAAYRRIRRVWVRPVWDTFYNELLSISSSEA